MNITLDIDVKEFKRNSTSESDRAFIAAMGSVGVNEENVLKFLALRKLGLEYDNEDRTFMWDGAEIWYAASSFFSKEAKTA
jgi:hypothetical protein